MTHADLHPGLSFRTLDPDDTPEEVLDGWWQAMRRGFHEPRGQEAGRAAWLGAVRRDRITLRGAWEDAPPLGAGTMPVATMCSWDQTINLGTDPAAVVPLHMISDVTVSPAHRRRGLLRSLMTTDLADAAAAGVPLAALTVSEGSIYGRFGFGLATHVRHVEVDVTARFALREPAYAAGRVVLVEPAEAWPAVVAVRDAVHRTGRGSVAMPAFYEPWLTGALDPETGSPDPGVRTVVRLDERGEPDGYAVYKVSPGEGRPGVVHISDLQATGPGAYLELWRYLASLDLVDRARWRKAPLDDPLPWALTDPLVVTTTKLDDLLWVRVLDVPRTLQARPWGADGSVVVEVDDPMGYTAGRWRITTSGGVAGVAEEPGAEPDLRLAADTLGSLVLGGVGVTTLAAAGRLAGSVEAVSRLAAMAEVGPAPYCSTGF